MNERSIFMAALEQESLPERSAYVDEACGGDAALRQRVEALLASHEQAGSFLRMPVPERLAWFLLGQLLRRQLAQLVVNERQELLRGVRIALLNGG